MTSTEKKYRKNIGLCIRTYYGPMIITGIVWKKEIFGKRCWHYQCRGEDSINYTTACYTYLRNKPYRDDTLKAKLL